MIGILKMNDEIILDYKGIKIYKRILANLIDFFIKLILSLVFILISSLIYKSLDLYINLENTISNIEIESKLFIKENDINIEITSYTLNLDISYEEKYNYLKENIDYFFIDLNAYLDIEEEGKKELDALKINSGYFELIDNELIEKEEVTYLTLYSFYKDKVYLEAKNNLYNNESYSLSVSKNFLISVLIYVFSYLLSVIIINFIFPLIFKRGRLTIGRKIFKIGLVNNKGLSLSLNEFIRYFLFYFIFEDILSLFTFLLPKLLSYLMIIFSRFNQGFTEYVLNFYLVSYENKKIYLNKEEYYFLNNIDKK